MKTKLCPTCQGPLIQKSIARLWSVGIGLFAGGVILIYFSLKLWPLSLFAWAISAYLIAWALAGKGLWCRECKSFPRS